MKQFSALFLSLHLIYACSGVEMYEPTLHTQELGSETSSESLSDGYQNWQRTNPEPIVRIGQSEAWYSYIGPSSKIKNGVFAPGSILVKEVRKLMGTENDPKIGAVKMLSIMLKEDQGWKYMAVDPVTNQNIESVDTDGCAWCHEDRKHSDVTFRALEAL